MPRLRGRSKAPDCGGFSRPAHLRTSRFAGFRENPVTRYIYICICMYAYIHIHMTYTYRYTQVSPSLSVYIYIYIYIDIERERDKDLDGSAFDELPGLPAFGGAR